MKKMGKFDPIKRSGSRIHYTRGRAPDIGCRHASYTHAVLPYGSHPEVVNIVGMCTLCVHCVHTPADAHTSGYTNGCTNGYTLQRVHTLCHVYTSICTPADFFAERDRFLLAWCMAKPPKIGQILGIHSVCTQYTVCTQIHWILYTVCVHFAN
jgi:hypothetical protein